MHRPLQFGMRENPASDRRHGSRLAVSIHIDKNSVEQGAQVSPPESRPDSEPSAGSHAAQRQAATAKEKERDERFACFLPLSNSESLFEPLLGSEQAARLLGNIHIKTLQRYARAGNLPSYRIAGHWYFRASELDAWLRSRINSSCHPCRSNEEAK
jgi:excisionase family DNA binding protein